MNPSDPTTPHECHESRTCSCYILGLEPDEDCPIHGGGKWPPRCEVCGKFVSRKQQMKDEETTSHG